MAPAAPSSDARFDVSGRPMRMISSPKAMLMQRARLLMETDRFLSLSPSAWATSVWVLIPRKLKIQKRPDSATAPTPRAARDSAPSCLMKAVSTRPVSGSAISESKTGKVSRMSVAWGLFEKGWSVVVAVAFAVRIFTQRANRSTARSSRSIPGGSSATI